MQGYAPRDYKASFALHVDDDRPGAGAIELAHHNALPGTKHEPPIFDNQGKRWSDGTGLHVRVGISFNVTIITFTRKHVIKTGEDICFDIRIGVLIDGDSTRRVRRKHDARTILDPRAFAHAFDGTRDVDDFLAFMRRYWHVLGDAFHDHGW